MTAHIVFDLETLSSRADAAIVSIGAVLVLPDKTVSLAEVFHPSTSFKSSELSYPAFYSTIHDPIGHIDPNTVMWWLTQSQEARDALQEPSLNEQSVLSFFEAWIKRVGGSDFRIWSHATFDPPVMESAFSRYGLYWPHNKMRDLRTEYELAGGLNGHEFGDLLINHHALHDAYREALSLIAAWEAIGTIKPSPYVGLGVKAS